MADLLLRLLVGLGHRQVSLAMAVRMTLWEAALALYSTSRRQQSGATVATARWVALAATLTLTPALLRLMMESVSTFLVLSRHALLLSGIETGWQKRDVTRNVAALQVDAIPFDTLLDLRERKKKPGDVDVDWLFANYLKQIEAVVAHVDRLEK